MFIYSLYSLDVNPSFLWRGNALVSENSQAARSHRFGISGGRPSFDGGERHKRMNWVPKPLITVRQPITSSGQDDLAPPQQAHLHDVPHHSARHPSHISYTPELGGSHTAIAAPLSSAVECYGCYKLTGPATVVVKTGRSGNSMEAYLGRGATLEWYHPDGNMVLTHVVSAGMRLPVGEARLSIPKIGCCPDRGRRGRGAVIVCFMS